MYQIRKSSSFAILAALATFGVSASAAQFSYLDPPYTQEIYTGPLVGGPGMAWTSSNNLLTRNGSDILEYSPTQNATYQGTSLHASIATHSVAGLNSSGYGLVKGTDGYIYTPTGFGLQRFDPNNWAAPAQSLAGTVAGQGYGITSLPNGKIIYVAGPGTNEVYSYTPSSGTNTLLYTAPTLLDDIEANTSGVIALAGQGNNSIILINSAGSVLTSFATTDFPDGLAFGNGSTSSALFSNDNHGTITEYDFGAGFSAAPTAITVIASGGSYGDLASVGPDCALYVSQFYNAGYHGSALFGTNWDNATTNNDPSIIRIAAKDGSCAFQCSPVPEPGNLALMLAGLGFVFRRVGKGRVGRG
jgi:hypothetical protein